MEEQGAQRLAANSVLFIWPLFSFLLILNGLDQKGLDWISMISIFRFEQYSTRLTLIKVLLNLLYLTSTKDCESERSTVLNYCILSHSAFWTSVFAQFNFRVKKTSYPNCVQQFEGNSINAKKTFLMSFSM